MEVLKSIPPSSGWIAYMVNTLGICELKGSHYRLKHTGLWNAIVGRCTAVRGLKNEVHRDTGIIMERGICLPGIHIAKCVICTCFHQEGNTVDDCTRCTRWRVGEVRRMARV